MLTTISDCAEILLHLINNILDVIKIRTGDVDLSIKETDIRK